MLSEGLKDGAISPVVVASILTKLPAMNALTNDPAAPRCAIHNSMHNNTHNSAIGFTGDPVARSIRSGATVNIKLQRPLRAHASANRSRRRLSSR